MSKQKAQAFFDELEKNPDLRAKIKLGLESLAKIAAGYDVTEAELTEELHNRWKGAAPANPHYSEPPGF